MREEKQIKQTPKKLKKISSSFYKNKLQFWKLHAPEMNFKILTFKFITFFENRQ